MTAPAKRDMENQRVIAAPAQNDLENQQVMTAPAHSDIELTEIASHIDNVSHSVTRHDDYKADGNIEK